MRPSAIVARADLVPQIKSACAYVCVCAYEAHTRTGHRQEGKKKRVSQVAVTSAEGTCERKEGSGKKSKRNIYAQVPEEALKRAHASVIRVAWPNGFLKAAPPLGPPSTRYLLMISSGSI